MADSNQMSWVKLEMAMFDELPYEMRVAVTEYGSLPHDNETVDEYVARQESYRILMACLREMAIMA